MSRLGTMIRQLGRYQSQWDDIMKAGGSYPTMLGTDPGSGRLTEVPDFGSNPGNLRMLTYVPDTVSPSPALVLVLHGCTQTAADYDHGAGWSSLADRYGFVLVFADQQESNNPRRCFNWFRPEDTQPGRGEAQSIRDMVEQAARDHGVDRSRIFVTGLSAGGAMTATMLAAYPDVFAGGAIVAGLPHGAASSVAEAFEAMFQGQTRSAKEWGDLVRSASPHRGPWPKVSVWHGSADGTVKPMNAGEIVKQWTDVHGLRPAPDREEVVDGQRRRVWKDAAGEDVLEEFMIPGMSHGTPLATGAVENAYGAAGPFLLDVGISSSYHIAKFWGLTDSAAETALPKAARRSKTVVPFQAPSQGSFVRRKTAADQKKLKGKRMPVPSDVGSVITKALKAAGLIK